MSRSTTSNRSRAKRGLKEEPQNLAKQLRIVAVVSVLGAIAVGMLVAWEQWFSVPPEQLVKVYRVHGCRCVFGWVRSLEAEGFKVNLLEIESLQRVRASLHTPASMGGCHVAGYLGYFVEGHVAPAALRRLAEEHPKALGVVTHATTEIADHQNTYREQSSPVILIGPTGQSQPWPSQGG